MLHVSREKSRKTEGVFLVASRGFRGEIEIPPGSFSFCHFFFWRSKRKSDTAAADFRKCSYIDRLVVDHKKRCKFKATLPVRVRGIQHGLARGKDLCGDGRGCLAAGAAAFGEDDERERICLILHEAREHCVCRAVFALRCAGLGADRQRAELPRAVLVHDRAAHHAAQRSRP